jgi:hypothetical protein
MLPTGANIKFPRHSCRVIFGTSLKIVVKKRISHLTLKLLRRLRNKCYHFASNYNMFRNRERSLRYQLSIVVVLNKFTLYSVELF